MSSEGQLSARTSWFGQHWGAPVCNDLPHVVTPAGDKCDHCGEMIAEKDEGFIYLSVPENGLPTSIVRHLNCEMRLAIGSVAHQLGQCGCFIEGSQESDPPDLTKREAADLAIAIWHANQLTGDKFHERTRNLRGGKANDS